MTLETLYELWKKTPTKWKLWVASAIVGLIIIWIWDIGTLLALFLVVSLVAALLRGLLPSSKLEQFALEQFWGRIRGMIIFAFLPTLFVTIGQLLSDFSLSSLISVLVVLFVILFIWDWFEKLPKRWRF